MLVKQTIKLQIKAVKSLSLIYLFDILSSISSLCIKRFVQVEVDIKISCLVNGSLLEHKFK